MKNKESNNESHEVSSLVTTAKNEIETPNPTINSVDEEGIRYHCFGLIKKETFDNYYPNNPVHSIESTPNKLLTNDTFTFFKDRMTRVMLVDDDVAKALNLPDKKTD